ncbi:MAG: hypothetical protein RLZZ600_1283 [Actinomycetota bacterium]
MAPARKPLLPLRFRAGASLCAAVLVVSAIIAAQFSPLVSVSPAAAVCQGPVLDCTSGSITGGGVNLVRSKTKPGAVAKPGTRTPGGSIIVVPPPSWSSNVTALICAIMFPRPWYCPPPASTRVTPAIPATPAVTLSDLASFVPRTPGLETEPAGWAIVSLPANMIANEPTHDVSGRLLGTNATVRFTPFAYTWTFGDGQSATTTTPGATWSALGLPAFSPTATSHIYTSTGVFTVRVVVSLRASYRLAGGSWTAVAGTLQRTTSAIVRVSRGSRPVLVTGDCLLNQRAVGC